MNVTLTEEQLVALEIAATRQIAADRRDGRELDLDLAGALRVLTAVRSAAWGTARAIPAGAPDETIDAIDSARAVPS